MAAKKPPVSELAVRWTIVVVLGAHLPTVAQVLSREYGLPELASALAYDPVQDLLAVGSKWGVLEM